MRADLPEGQPKVAHDLSEHDAMATLGPGLRKRPELENVTPRQHSFKEGLRLPKLLRYPSMPKELLLFMRSTVFF